jgi:hypothetical protein
MENKLVIFISSLIGELADERYAAKEAVEAIPFTRPWVFEYTPASTDPLEESYLVKVRECDLFILLLGQNITDPVRKEWQTAVAAGKPRLVLLKKGERNPEAQAFVKTIDVKWAEFATLNDLKRQVQEAVTDELIRSYRRYRLQSRDLGPLGEFLERLGQSGTVVKVDNRSGGVYFEGKGSAHIEGDVIGGDQTKTSR